MACAALLTGSTQIPGALHSTTMGSSESSSMIMGFSLEPGASAAAAALGALAALPGSCFGLLAAPCAAAHPGLLCEADRALLQVAAPRPLALRRRRWGGRGGGRRLVPGRRLLRRRVRCPLPARSSAHSPCLRLPHSMSSVSHDRARTLHMDDGTGLCRRPQRTI